MGNGLTTIMKKEFARFFGDRRIIVTSLILPGLMIYFTYSLMGQALVNNFIVGEDYQPLIYAQNLPASIAEKAQSESIAIIATEDINQIMLQIQDQQADALLVFPADFDEAVEDYETFSGEAAPQISLYFNSASQESGNTYSILSSMLDVYESSLANKFDINSDDNDTYDLATEEDTSSHIIAGMLPMLLMIFLFSGCLAIAPESIAGEKERGTIATLLVTPLKRGQLAIGKLLSLSILSILCGMSSIIGTMLALPKLMGGSGSNVTMTIYGPSDYLLLGAVVLSTVLLIVSLISIVSVFAKTIKEATTAVTPLMVVVMLLGASAMFSSGAQSNSVMYLVPLYNSVQSLVGVFSRDYTASNLALSIVSNLVYAGIGGFVLARLFNNEKVVFSK